MNLTISSLSNTPLSEITRCFNEAFSDYIIQFNASEEYLHTRWKIARVNYGLSFGAFDGEKLVGFIMHGIGERDGLRTAHNTATGIEPAYRGLSLLNKIYDEALAALRKHGIEQSTLEVISTNERAIRAYQKVGFQLRPGLLHCFKGTLQASTPPPDGVEIRRAEKPDWPLYDTLLDFPLTWELTPEAIAVSPDSFEYRELWVEGEFGGYLIIAKGSGLILQFVIRSEFRRQGFGQLLFAELVRESPHVRVVNVPAKAKGTLRFLEYMGMENHVDQYEMELQL